MSPGPSCPGCFLSERRGVCPMAEHASELDRAEARRRAELLRVSVLAEVPDVLSLVELVRREAQHGRQTAVQGALPPAPNQTILNDSRKEFQHDSYRPRSVR